MLERLWILPTLAACWSMSAGCLPPDCRPGDGLTLQIGTGVEGFVALAEPPALELVYGPQGGVHVDISLRATQLTMSDLWAVGLRGVVAGVVRADVRAQVEPGCNVAVEAQEIVGLRLIWNDDVSANDLLDPVTVFIDVTDAAGSSVEASVEGVSIVFP
jgi:hypothetical protein